MVRKSQNDFEFDQLMASHLPPRRVVHSRKKRVYRKKKVRIKKSSQSFRIKTQEQMIHETAEPGVLSRVERRKREQSREDRRHLMIEDDQQHHLSRVKKRKTKQRKEREQRFKLVLIRLLTFLFILLPILIVIAFFYFQNGDRPPTFPGEKPDSFEQVEIEK